MRQLAHVPIVRATHDTLFNVAMNETLIKKHITFYFHDALLPYSIVQADQFSKNADFVKEITRSLQNLEVFGITHSVSALTTWSAGLR